MKLTSKAVHELTAKCLAAEPTEASIRPEGIQLIYVFDPEKIAENEATIVELLLELPDEISS